MAKKNLIVLLALMILMSLRTVPMTFAEDAIIISIAVSDEKTQYVEGEDFEKPTVTATYDDGTTREVTDAVFSGYDKNTLGFQTVHVSYGGKFTWYYITVRAKAVSIGLSASSLKTLYYVGDTFKRPNGTVRFSDGSGSGVSNLPCYGYDMSKPGVQTVTVKYYEATRIYQITVLPVSNITTYSGCYDDGTGLIRFVTKLDKERDNISSYGTYIIPLSLFESNYDAKATLQANNSNLKAGESYLADLYNIPAEHFDTEILAISYLVVDDNILRSEPIITKVDGNNFLGTDYLTMKEMEKK